MRRLALGELRVGDLLAQGGEGSVYQLPLQPHLVFKAFRGDADRGYLDDLVAWPDLLAEADAEVVRSSAAWPVSVVAGEDGRAVGLVMPRAPRRFSVRHRDGQRRLATLSYLTCDPDRPARAYGIAVPPPGDAGRYGLVLALAKLLSAFDSVDTAVSHGDLSTKNVLWSLERGPEVYVIDCDSAEVLASPADPDVATSKRPARRRAMTPNWDDPAVKKGDNPTLESDRYSLGLIFLRVVGAANFPVQARQRREGRLNVEVPVPAGPAAKQLLDARHPLWELCSRALSVEGAGSRPAAAEWVEPLGEVMASLGGAAAPAKSVAPSRPAPSSRATDVEVTPRPLAATRVAPNPSGARSFEAELAIPPGAETGGWRYKRAPSTTARSAKVIDDKSLRVQARILWRAFWRWWAKAHREALRAVRKRGRKRRALVRVLGLMALDFALVGVSAGLVALVVSPITRG